MVRNANPVATCCFRSHDKRGDKPSFFSRWYNKSLILGGSRLCLGEVDLWNLGTKRNNRNIHGIGTPYGIGDAFKNFKVSDQVALGTKCKCGESCAAGTLVFGSMLFFIVVAKESWDFKIGVF